MRSDVAHSALSADMYLQAAADQSEMSDLLHPTQTIGNPCAPCGAPRQEGPNGSGSGSSGCSTVATSDGAGETVAILLGLVSFGGAGVRPWRRSRRAR